MPEPHPDDHWHARAREVLQRCEELARCTDVPGTTTRTYLSPATSNAQQLLLGWMEVAGLSARVDAVGNVVGRLAAGASGGGSAATVVLIGSHLDTVPNAGKYDGILGVLCALAVAEELRSQGVQHHLDVIAFSEEEGVRFGAPFIGSLAAIGQLPPEMLELQDRAGNSMRGVISQFGLDPDAVESAAYAPGSIAAFAELHIEQGPVLESCNAALGVVTAIAGQTRLQCRLSGAARHAGTTPMAARRDALAAAAEIVLKTEELARCREGLVATIGALEVHPNASNCVPGEVVFTLDVRHAEDSIRTEELRAWKAMAEEAANNRGIDWTILAEREQPTIPCDAHLQEQLAASVAATTGSTAKTLPSGAGHDAMILARVAPISMLFVRCADGISHHPDEAVSINDVALGLQAFTGFVRGLCCAAPAPTDLQKVMSP